MVVVVALASAVVMTAKADWEFNSQPDAYPYRFGPSALVPRWSETNAGEWTFNYEGVLEKAKSEGKYTLLLFAGFWWCPHCQALDEILVKDEFKDYAARQGYYLAALDFPFRDGHSMWTWLWDPAYRAANGIGDWTPQQIADEYVKRFEFQDLMHAQNGATATNNNVLVEISADGTKTNLAVYAENPTTVYRRIGFPTIIVISPDGKEIGRFEYSLTMPPEDGLGYVIGNIETIKAVGRSELFERPGAGGIEGSTAQTYDGVLMDSNGVPVGTATFKTAKRDRISGVIKVTGHVKMADGRTATVKGIAGGAEGEVISLKKADSPVAATVTIGAEGFSGSYSDGKVNYLVQGARNPFKGRDEAAKARASTLKKGFWTFALMNDGSTVNALAEGYSAFSVATAAEGKVKIVGFLGDGSRVSVSSQVLMGEGGKVLVPVIGKKGAFSMMLEFDNWELSAITGVSGWKSVTASAKWSSYAALGAAAGTGAMPDTMYLRLGDFDDSAEIGGMAIAVSPANDAVMLNGRKWTGTKGVSDLKVTYYPKNGTFKGSFNVYVKHGERIRKKKAKVSGIVVDGVPYGTAVIKDTASWSVKLAALCGGGC